MLEIEKETQEFSLHNRTSSEILGSTNCADFLFDAMGQKSILDGLVFSTLVITMKKTNLAANGLERLYVLL